MKTGRLLLRSLCCLLFLLMLINPVFASEVLPPAEENISVSGSYSTDATQQLIGPELQIENVKAAFLYEANTQTLMFALNPDEQLAPSSLVKIMTALLVLERGSLTDSVTVQQSTLDSVAIGAASADLLAGETMPLGDLLYCMMVGSANDAAAVMAEHIAGTQSAFVALMNERAAALGCTGTNFVNVHGLHDPQQVTTVRDMTKILVDAMKNELFRAVFSAISYTVPATNLSEQRYLASNNFLRNNTEMPLYYDARVTGGRTGTANDGTRCLASTAESDGMYLVCVVMGSESKLADKSSSIQVYGGFNETKQLLDAGFTGYKPAQILFKGQVLTQREVQDGENLVSIGPDVTISTILPAQVSSQDLSFRYTDGGVAAKGPIRIGDPVTDVEIWYGGLCVAKSTLYAINDVAVGNRFSIEQMQNSGSGIWKVILLALAAIAVTAVAVLFVIRLIANIRWMSAKKRSKHRRQSRRRSW